jgi:hypothetical protein
MRLSHRFRAEQSRTDGRSYDVQYYRWKPGNVWEPAAQFCETPVVLADRTVQGLGWDVHVEAGIGKLTLPTPFASSRQWHRLTCPGVTRSRARHQPGSGTQGAWNAEAW